MFAYSRPKNSAWCEGEEYDAELCNTEVMLYCFSFLSFIIWLLITICTCIPSLPHQCTQHSKWYISVHNIQSGISMYTAIKVVYQCTQHSKWYINVHNIQSGISMYTTFKVVYQCTQHSKWYINLHNNQSGISIYTTIKVVYQCSQHSKWYINIHNTCTFCLLFWITNMYTFLHKKKNQLSM